MLFHAFKMAVSIASLRVNASDQIQPLNLHFLDQALFFQIYIDGPPGVPGVSKNQNFISTYESVHFLADKTYRIGFFRFLGLGFWGFIFLCGTQRAKAKYYSSTNPPFLGASWKGVYTHNFQRLTTSLIDFQLRTSPLAAMFLVFIESHPS